MTEDDLAKLTKCLGMLGSAHDGEALAARNMCDRILRRHKLTWADVPNLKAPKSYSAEDKATQERGREEQVRRERERQERERQEERAREERSEKARQMASLVRRGGAVFFVILAVVIGSRAHRDYNKLATPAVMSTPAQGKNLTEAQQLAALAPAPSYSFGSLAKSAPISGGTEKASDESLLMALINRQLHLPAEARARGMAGGTRAELGGISPRLSRTDGQPGKLQPKALHGTWLFPSQSAGRHPRKYPDVFNKLVFRPIHALLWNVTHLARL
jgi:hypothetical protein